MDKRLYTLLFTVLITAVFGGAVTVLKVALAEQTARNMRNAEQTALLQLFGIKNEQDSWDTLKVDTTFREKIEAVKGQGLYPNAKGIKQPIHIDYYRLKEKPNLVAFPIEGMGFWEKIEGYLAADLETDTIFGIDFLKQGETPGLGGRISEPWFREQFVGKSMKGIEIVARPKPESKVQVEAITGATQTSNAVESLLNESVRRFDAVRTDGEAK